MIHPRPDLALFDLERWMRGHQHGARYAIGGSGCPQHDLDAFLPRGRASWRRAWRAHPDQAVSALREALAQAYGLPGEEFLPTNGASEADFVAALALAGPGGHVVVESPAYFALLEPARALGCRVARVPRNPDDGFRWDVGHVLDAMTSSTRLVVLARPNNPTGERVSDRDLREIAEAADRVDAYVLVDEVFAEATREGDRPARRLHDRILSVNSLTKCLGFGPLHVGWIAAPRRAAEALERAKWHIRPLVPVLNLAIGARVLAQRKTLLRRTRTLRARNAPIVERFLRDALGPSWRAPDHGTTCVVRVPTAMGGDVDFARRLLKDEGVLVAPGSYIELPGWIRLSLVAPTETLRQGLRRLGQFLSASQGTQVPRRRR